MISCLLQMRTSCLRFPNPLAVGHRGCLPWDPSVISSHSGAAEVLSNALRADFWDTDKFAKYLYALLHYRYEKYIDHAAAWRYQGPDLDKTADSIMHVYNELVTA